MWIWTKMAYISLLLLRASWTKNFSPRFRRMPRINMLVDLIESLNTIKEEADGNSETSVKHSLALKDKVIIFVEAIKHKIGEDEEEAQDHYATITKFKCPDNPNHVAQSMAPLLQDEFHSPLPTLLFPAIPYLSNTSTSSNMYEQFHLRMFCQSIFDPGGSLCVLPWQETWWPRASSGRKASLSYIYIHLNKVSIADLALEFYPPGRNKSHLWPSIHDWVLRRWGPGGFRCAAHRLSGTQLDRSACSCFSTIIPDPCLSIPGLVCPDCDVAWHWVGPATNAPIWSLYRPSAVALPKWQKRKTTVGQPWTPCTLYFRLA